jgi:hypothetical protein
MRKLRTSLVGLFVVAGSSLAGGCVDAIGDGAATGLADGIAAVIENWIIDAVANAGDGE